MITELSPWEIALFLEAVIGLTVLHFWMIVRSNKGSGG